MLTKNTMKIRREDVPLQHKFILRRSTRRLPLSAASRSSSNAAVRLETPSGSATPARAGVIVGTRRTGYGTPACAVHTGTNTHAGRVLPNPPLNQWPPVPSSPRNYPRLAASQLTPPPPPPTIPCVAPPHTRTENRQNRSWHRNDHTSASRENKTVRQKAIRFDVPGPTLPHSTAYL